MLRSSTDKTVCYVANWIVGIYDSIFKISNELCNGGCQASIQIQLRSFPDLFFIYLYKIYTALYSQTNVL